MIENELFKVIFLREKPRDAKGEHLDTNNDPDLTEAVKELDEEFPGAEYDISLHKYLRRKTFIRKIVKKIIFHAVCYTLCVIVLFLFFRKTDFSVWNSLVFGLLWFLGYFLYTDSVKTVGKQTEHFDSRPYDKPMEGKL